MFIIQLSNEGDYFKTSNNSFTSTTNKSQATTFLTRVVASKAIADLNVRVDWPKSKVVKWEK